MTPIYLLRDWYALSTKLTFIKDLLISNESIEFSCSNCGSNKFNIPDNPKPTDIVSCCGCNGEMLYSVMESEIERQSLELVDKTLGDIFK